MQSIETIIKCYDDVADDYAAHRSDELSKKHLDRLLLKEFALMNKEKGLCADFGCGPGHTTKFLYDHGLKNIIGIDISARMIDVAKRLFPKIKFETGDLLNIAYKSDYFRSVVAFYAIVHFTYDQIKMAFSEVNRVLKKEGQFLFSFHAGDKIVHFDKANDIDVDIDLYFFQTEKIIELLQETGFQIIDAIERHPYNSDVEYQSKRTYILAEKI
ncbi:MAG: class I SAM-dependent methyltransferase [Bacteroidota bacterium]|nr:class I SAM-dependent methyltransferase [Bacteroidota bacterium]